MLAEETRCIEDRERQGLVSIPIQVDIDRSEPFERHARELRRVRARRIAKRDDEIQFAAIEPLEQQSIAVDDGVDAHGGMRTLEVAERRRQPGFGEIGGQADSHDAIEPFSLQRRERFVVEIENASGIRKQRFACGRQNQSAALSFEERRADALFELVDLLADRGLRAADMVRRPIEAAESLRRDERSQHVHIEIHPGHGSVS